MNASRLWTVWNKLNLWPWLSALVGGIIFLVFYSFSSAEGNLEKSPINSRSTDNIPSSVSDNALSGFTIGPSTNELSEKVGKSLSEAKDSATQFAAKVEQKVKQEVESVSDSLRTKTGSSGNPKEWVTLGNSSSLSSNEGLGFKELAGKSDSSLYIATGSVFRAQLIMPIKTSVQERFVMAQTTHEFRDPSNSSKRIPVGSRLIGRAQLNTALRGVDVRFTTLVTPKGKEYPIQVLALSRSLFAELNGIFFSNELETYSTIMAFGFVEGFADSAKERQNTVIGQVAKDTVSNKVLDGVGSASFRVAEEMMHDIRNKAVEYVVVPSGEEIFAVFTERFVLPGGKSLE